MTNEDDSIRAKPDPSNPQRLQPTKGTHEDANAQHGRSEKNDGVEAPPGISDNDEVSGAFRRDGA